MGQIGRSQKARNARPVRSVAASTFSKCADRGAARARSATLPSPKRMALRLVHLCGLLALQRVAPPTTPDQRAFAPESIFTLVRDAAASDERVSVAVPQVLAQGADGAPGEEAHHPCASWCAEQLAAYQLKLAELRYEVAVLRQDSRVEIKARPSVSSELAAQPIDFGDGVVSARAQSPGTRSGLNGTSDERTKRVLLQTGASSLEAGGSALPCNKIEVGDIVAAGDNERVAVFEKLASSNPLCAACIFPCAAKPGFDPVLCAYGCHHQIENSCSTETGWERARPLLDQVDLRSRDSLIRLMTLVHPPNAAQLHDQLPGVWSALT